MGAPLGATLDIVAEKHGRALVDQRSRDAEIRRKRCCAHRRPAAGETEGTSGYSLNKQS